MQPDIVIVGAGPVGLFTAIEMKLRDPELNIKILERNTEYTRHHILQLEKESLITSKAYETYREVKELHGFIPTSEIESTFLKIAQELHIEIERNSVVEDCQALLKQYPEAHTIIGADGAHSIIRRQLFDDKKIVDTNLQYIVEIKYKAKGRTSRLSNLVYGPALGQVHHLVSENVGKIKDNSTPVSLFLFIDEKTYKEIRKIPNAKLRDLRPTTKKMRTLLDTIRPWLALRRAAVHEEMIEDSEKINGIALNIYQSECFAKETSGKRVYLVGDAAAAVPYFRALNAGLIAATLTAATISESSSRTLPNFELLNKVLAGLTQNEISRAHKKNKKVNWGIGLNFFLSNLPKLTGAILRPDYTKAMLNARVTRPNIFRRNPRNTLILGLFILTTTILFTVAMTVLALTLWPATLLALAGSTAIVGTTVLLFKLIKFIMDRVREKNNPITPLAEFPWGIEEKEEDPLTPLSKLSDKMVKSQPTGSHQERNIIHFPSPLKQKLQAENELFINPDVSPSSNP